MGQKTKNSDKITVCIYTICMRKHLPTFYYLDHFNEFIGYIEAHCAALLRPDDRAFVNRFLVQDRDTQCVLVRALNRKSPFIKIDSLEYAEINDERTAIANCMNNKWFISVTEEHFTACLAQLTKVDLLDLLAQNSTLKFTKSASKGALLTLVQNGVAYREFMDSELAKNIVYRAIDDVLEYLLFLFFGYLHGRLNQFSMRDLGIMRTRKNVTAGARFKHCSAATSAYFWAKLKYRDKYLANIPIFVHNEFIPTFIPPADLPEADGALALDSKDEFCWSIGKQLLAKVEPEWLVPYGFSVEQKEAFAWSYLAASRHPKAQEKLFRLRYAAGAKEEVEAELLAIISTPENEQILVFAEDFLARKYHKKKTSTLTDWLRTAKRSYVFEEVHKNRVERAVVEFYTGQGLVSYKTENELFKSLFGLVFWDIMFAKNAPAGNEFDTRPHYIIHNNLYQECTAQVDGLLKKLGTCKALAKHVVQQATLHYGKPNGIFRWHKNIIKRLGCLLQYSDIKAVQGILFAMAENYALYHDGFPDIMVVEDNALRFEEIKATGDVLRKNQLITMAKLKECGFTVDITQVQWGLNPQQPYVVVDIETTGGRAEQHRITEIGIVKVINGQEVDRWQTLLNPQRMIPKNITQLTGIDNALVADAPVFAEIADELAHFTQGCVFVAHNVNFDFSFIKAEFQRLDRHYSRPKLCTVREMRKAFPGLASYSLANLTRHFSIDMTRHHRAMSDAVAAAALLHLVNEKRAEYSVALDSGTVLSELD